MENYKDINEAGPVIPKGLSRVRNINLRTTLAKMVTAMEETLSNKKLFKQDNVDLKTFSKTLLKQPGMIDAYFDVANSMSMKKFKKNFNDLDDLAKQDVIKDVDTVWHEELKKQVGDMKKYNKSKTTATQKTGGDTTKLLKQSNDIAKIEDALKKHVLGSSIHSLDDLKKILKGGSKVKSAESTSFLKKFKIPKIFSRGRRVTTTDNPSFLRRTIKVIVVNATAKGTLIALFKIGALGFILSEFFGVGDNETAVIVDEKGKDIFETETNDKTEMGSVLNQFIEAGGVKTKNGGVNVVTPEYPKGLTYYSNGRVLNNETGEMGSWMLNEGISLLDLLNEQEDEFNVDNKLIKDVDAVIDLLDFPVSKSNLKDAFLILKPYTSNGKGKEFLDLYKRSGLGSGSLEKSIKHVFTMDPESATYKKNINNVISKMASGVTKTTTTTTSSNGQSVTQSVTSKLPKTMITWDGGSMSTTGGSGSGNVGQSNPTSTSGGQTSVSGTHKPKKSSMKFHDCTGKDFPLEFGCVNNRIKDLQSCLGLTPDGKFGPRTLKMLKDYANDVPDNMLTYDIWNNITSSCQDSNNSGLHNIDSDNTQGVDLDNNNGNMNVDVNQSPNKFYKSLMKSGNIDTVFAPNGRDTLVRYRGPELAEDDLTKLDTALNGMNFIRTTEPTISGTYLYKRK